MKQFLFKEWRQLTRLSVNPRFWLILLGDIALVLVANLLAYHIRYEGGGSLPNSQILAVQPILVLVKIPVFYFFGLYRGMWRYTSISDLLNIAKATAVSSLLLVLTLVYWTHFLGYSRAVYALDAIFTFLLICLHRGTIRYWFENFKHFRESNGQTKRRLLMIGAGSAAEKVIREIRDNVAVPYHVVGLVDDDPNKFGMMIHNIPVLGTVDELPKIVNRTAAEELLVTIVDATGDELRRIIDACRESGLKFKLLPSLGEIILGDLSVSRMREVDYRDLLGRPVVHLNQQEICDYLTDRTVMVTGAGGSIGSELCRQILSFHPGKIILFDSGEENLYNIQMELQHDHGFSNCLPVLGKIQNRGLLNNIFCEYAPSVVFHAAAYKHVPLVEANPWEAIFNNVFAVRNLIETAIFHKTQRFVLVSTDKAVRPTNVMGASKRLTELLMLAYCPNLWDESLDAGSGKGLLTDCLSGQAGCSPEGLGHDTSFMAVRFGNVLGSSGSVIPLFKRQIKKGGPVTVTHPEMTRYFMSIPEAAQLILQAGAMGRGGEIFLLKMGKPVRIADLAGDLIKLMGYRPGIDIEIVFSGLRPGEKLYEELITEGEGIVPTSHEKIMVLHGDGKPYRELEQHLHELAIQAKNHNAREIKKTLKKIIPEYTPDLQAIPIIGSRDSDFHGQPN